jgi:formylglycine-generating enzyme required for sulfatase activity
MLLAMKIKAAITAAVLASPIALTIAPVAHPVDSAMTEIAAKPFQHRLAGDFSRDGKPAEAPLRDAHLAASIKIMNRQVTAGEYARCADDGGCPKIPHTSAMAERPMVGVSWRDATVYAEWLTNKTGVLHRLPTDEEWVYAAADKVRDEALPVVDPVDPAQAWIARYEAEANRGASRRARPATGRHLRPQRERATGFRRQCLGMDQQLLPARNPGACGGCPCHQH